MVDDEKHATFDESEQDAIASAFANSMFPHHDLLDQLEETQIQVGMASLQGYLLDHKRDPRGAAAGALTWADARSRAA